MTQKIIEYRGVDLNQRTIDMIEAAEWILGFKLRLTQGSYNIGGVQASAGTHDGGGAVDVAVKDPDTGVLFPAVRRKLFVSVLRQVGFAAWERDPSQGKWPNHVHAIAVGDLDLSDGAKAQVKAYRNNRNGLVSNLLDDGPRTWVGVTWELWEKNHPNWKEPFTMGQYENLIQEMKNQGDATRKEVREQAIWGQTYALEIADDLEAAQVKFDAAIKAGADIADAQAAFTASVSAIRANLKKRASDNEAGKV